MSRVEAFEESVRVLSDEELAAFRAGFVSFDAEARKHSTMGVAGDLELRLLSGRICSPTNARSATEGVSCPFRTTRPDLTHSR